MQHQQQQQQQWELQQQQQQQHQQESGGIKTVGTSNRCTNRVAAVLSVFLVVCGVLSVIFNSVDIGVNFSPLVNEDMRYDEQSELDTIEGYTIFKTTGFVAHGIWSGVMCVTAGMFGLITTCKNGSKCMVFTSLVLSTVCAALAFLQFSIAVLGAWYISYFSKVALLYCLTETPTPENCLPLKGLLAMEILLAILGFFGGLAAIISSALRCRSMGCCTENTI